MRLVNIFENTFMDRDALLPKMEELYVCAFPAQERKPFAHMVEKAREGVYEIFAVLSPENAFTGFCITILYEDFVLIDYLAVAPEFQGQGYGSKILTALFDRYQGKKILLEIESTKVTGDNQEERIRRKDFYSKNGMTPMDYEIYLFGVQMEIMTYHCNVSYEEYHAMLIHVLPENLKNQVQLKSGQLTIRKAVMQDLATIMKIYDIAKDYMVRSGNPTQWSKEYPSVNDITKDIEKEQCYVCCMDDQIHGVFAFIIGADATYAHIEGDGWINEDEYGTIHRLAADGEVKGITAACMLFCKRQIHNLRADTHENNKTVQYLLEKNGFAKCGIIFVRDGSKRIAYQWVGEPTNYTDNTTLNK